MSEQNEQDRCPECLEYVGIDELEMFGGLCEECSMYYE